MLLCLFKSLHLFLVQLVFPCVKMFSKFSVIATFGILIKLRHNYFSLNPTKNVYLLLHSTTRHIFPFHLFTEILNVVISKSETSLYIFYKVICIYNLIEDMPSFPILYNYYIIFHNYLKGSNKLFCFRSSFLNIQFKRTA